MKKPKKTAEQQQILDTEIQTAQVNDNSQNQDVAQPQVEDNQSVMPEVQTEANTQSEIQTQPVEDVAQLSDDAQIVAQSDNETQTPTDAQQPVEDQSNVEGQDTVDTQLVADAQADGGKKKKKKEKNTDKAKKEPKVGLYVVSLFKYFNIITILPLALLMYAIFFASYIVDQGSLFEKNLVWICIILGIAAIVMIAWFITTFKKRRVCSFDAFLLMALLICASMITQCIIFKNFMSFDGIAIATLAATIAVFALLTVRLIMFKPSEQRKNDDAKYTAKNKVGMYFKVIFAKYAFFIAMLCVIGALLVLIITQSDIFEIFEFEATKLEMAVTIVFAAIAAILMVIGIFIRIVRGRANVVDCMPYMFFMVAIGGLIYFITRQTYMILYVAIAAALVGSVWLVLCQYTLLMSNYKKAESVEGESASSDGAGTQQIPVEEVVVSDAEAQNAEQTIATEPQTEVASQPMEDAQTVAEQPSVETSSNEQSTEQSQSGNDTQI